MSLREKLSKYIRVLFRSWKCPICDNDWKKDCVFCEPFSKYDKKELRNMPIGEIYTNWSKRLSQERIRILNDVLENAIHTEGDERIEDCGH